MFSAGDAAENFRSSRIKIVSASESPENNIPLILFTGSMELNLENLQKLNREYSVHCTKTIILHNVNAPLRLESLRNSSLNKRFIFIGLNYLSESPYSKLNNVVSRLNQIGEVMNSPYVKENIIGSGYSWHVFLFDVIEAGLFCSSPILLTGGSGTGKELAAGLINLVQKQKKISKGMIVVDCTTLQKDLAGSELFGHEKGSFTNAISAREGAVELADKGTLYLDEIGELPMEMQNILLRVLQEGTYKRVGGSFYRRSVFRLISATNRHLIDEVNNGGFREDLYYRISGSVLKTPLLCERKEDIPELAQYFFIKYFRNEDLSETIETPEKVFFESEAINFLKRREYRGNVRELEQLISRVAYKYTGGNITLQDILNAEHENIYINIQLQESTTFDGRIRDELCSGASLQQIKDLAVNTAINEAIAASGGVIKEAAAKLGVTERAIHHRRNGKCKDGGVSRNAAD